MYVDEEGNAVEEVEDRLVLESSTACAKGKRRSQANTWPPREDEVKEKEEERRKEIHSHASKRLVEETNERLNQRTAGGSAAFGVSPDALHVAAVIERRENEDEFYEDEAPWVSRPCEPNLKSPEGLANSPA